MRVVARSLRSLTPWVITVMVLSGSAATEAEPEPLSFRRLEHENGPSHNTIFAVLQDHRGFLWVATQDGLDRWDGVRFRSYRHDPADPASIAADQVYALLEDSAGRLWVATAAGVDRLDRARGVFVHTGRVALPGDGEWHVSELLQLRSGGLLAVGGSGLYRWDEQRETWARILPEIGAAIATREGPDGELWVLEPFVPGVRQRLWRRGRDGEGRFWRLDGWTGDGLSDFAVDPRGRIWLDATSPIRIHEDRGTLNLPWGSERPEVWPLSFLLTEDGTLWMGTKYEGIVRRRLDTVDWNPLGEARRVTISERRLGNWADALLIDDTGILWVGTEDGLYRHDPNLKAFRHWGTERPGRLPPVPVSAIVPASQDGWWVGTFGSGVFRLSGSGEVREHLQTAQTSSGPVSLRMTWSLAVHDGSLVVGLDDGILCRTPVQARRFRCARLGLSRVGHIVPAFGRLWVAGLDGMVLLDPSGFSPEEFHRRSDRLAERDLTVVAPIDEDEAFVGSWAGELLRFDRRRGAFRLVAGDPELGAPVLDLHDGGDGTLWIAHGGGLSRHDVASGATERIDFGSSVPGSNGFGILAGPAGSLWLGTNRGLVRYDPDRELGERLRHYGTADGLRNREYNRHSRASTGDRSLFLFGGEHGITLFAPDSIRDNPHPPPVRVVAAEVLGREGRRPVKAWGLKRLELFPGEDAFRLEVAALSFTAPDQNRYRHRLEGYDDRWIEAGGVREIRYSHLPPGSYVLRVQAANNDGVWNREGLALPVRVAPPFWRTWWFQASLGILALLAVYGVHHLRMRRLVEMERLRLRIAADLHDQLSSDLSGIALTTDLVRRRADLDEGDGSRLERVRDQALQSVRALRDIVWYVDPERDALASIGDRMREAAEDMLPDHDVRCEVRLPTGMEAPMLWRRDLFLAYKEMLHNVARHAAAERVDVELAAEDGALRLRVTDDGVGFDPDRTGSGAGLLSLDRRARALGGQVRVDSEPGSGTTVILEAPMPGRR